MAWMRDWRLVRVIELGQRLGRAGRPPAWYAHRGDKTYWLANDVVGHVHSNPGGWNWWVKSSTKFPEPPFLLTDDPCLFPAYNGKVSIRPTQLAGELLRGIPLMSLSGPGWLGVLDVTPGELAAGRGRLIAFSPTGEMPDAAFESVVMPRGNRPFGAIELPKRDLR